MRLRAFYFAALWIVVGIVGTIAVEVYAANRPQSVTISSLYPSPVKGLKPGLVGFDYTFPTSMVQGEVGDFHMHVTNYHLYGRNKYTGAPMAIPLTVTLTTSPNCSAVEMTTLPGAHHSLDAVGVHEAFDWSLFANAPGDCEVTVKSLFVKYLKPDAMAIPIRERWSAEQQATVLAGFIIALPGFLNFFRKGPVSSL